jgi:hypothetical protein
MKALILIYLIIILTAILGCHTTTKFGLYRGAEYTSGYSMILKADSTFEYRLRGHMISDTSAGAFTMKEDTIYFNYTYDHYKLSILPPPIPARPKYALWRKNKLYPFYSQDDKLNKKQVLKYIR